MATPAARRRKCSPCALYFRTDFTPVEPVESP
uniref:Uncharacterized protein n=1 Tax=Anguilla anguilla TaxID=7936 RepID=A0A0E9SE29_ANGAN